MAVWGAEYLLCQRHVVEPLLFLNVAAKYAGELALNFWIDCLVDADCPSETMATLKATAAEAGFAEMAASCRERLTSTHIITWDPDWMSAAYSQEALLSCCALLQLASEDVSVSLPQLLRVNGMRLEEPEAGDSVVDRTASRLSSPRMPGTSVPHAR